MKLISLLTVRLLKWPRARASRHPGCDLKLKLVSTYHRKLGFKSKDGGLARAKAGVMRRLSMTALRSTARHVLRGLAIVGPACIHQRNAREAARRAHLDAFGANRGAPWRDPTNGG